MGRRALLPVGCQRYVRGIHGHDIAGMVDDIDADPAVEPVAILGGGAFLDRERVAFSDLVLYRCLTGTTVQIVGDRMQRYPIGEYHDILRTHREFVTGFVHFAVVDPAPEQTILLRS